MKRSSVAAAVLVMGAWNAAPASAGQQRLNQVYWVDQTTCSVLAHPISVTKSNGPEGVTLSLRRGTVPVGGKQPMCQGRNIPGAWVIAEGKGSGPISYEVHYSGGQSSSHSANIDLH